jgi:hypothetical protein
MWQSKREISRECNDIIGSAKGSQISEKYWGEVGKGKTVDVYLEVRKRRGHIFFEWNKCLWAKCIVYMTKKIRIILSILDFKLGTIDNRKDYLQTWGEFFFFIFSFFFDKYRNTGFSSRHLLRLQKFSTNSRFRTGIFWIQWYRFDFVFILVI